MKKKFRKFTAVVIGLTACAYIVVGLNCKVEEQFISLMTEFSTLLLSCLIGMHFKEIQALLFNKKKRKEREAKRIEASKKYRHLIAVHESGHAIIATALLPCIKVAKISIIPNSESLGRVEYVDVMKLIWFKEECMALIARSYGGRVAEELILQVTSTASRKDMQDATEYAKDFVNSFAMKGKLATEIDDQDFNNVLEKANLDTIEEVCREAYTLAENTIRQNKEAVCKLAEILEKQEVIHQEEFEQFVKDNNVNEKNL